jgi:transposase
VRCAPLAQRPLADGLVVGLLPPQYVQPYVTINKNDFRDAEAIAEAVGPTRATTRSLA